MTRSPNILVIMTDQQAPNMLSITGTDWVKTPALDRLAAEGTRLEAVYCTNPVCIPSRTSMAIGIMPGRIGADTNWDGRQAVVPEEVAKNSLGVLMKRAGYDTFYGGKVHMCPQLHPGKGEAGYDVFENNPRKVLPKNCIQFMKTTRTRPFFGVASFINPHDICRAHSAVIGNRPVGETAKCERTVRTGE